MRLSEIIVSYRQEHDLSQRQMAAQCGLSTGYISLIEKDVNPQTGKAMIPTLPVLNKLAKGMAMSIDALLAVCDDMPVDIGAGEDESDLAARAELAPGDSINSIKSEIAKNLLFYRKRSHLTQKELAEKIGVKHNAVSSWESGVNSIDVEVLFRICEIFGVSVDDMYGIYGTSSRADLAPDELELLTLYRLATDDDKAVIDTVLRKYKNVGKKEKRA